jgi:amino acid permease
LDGNEALFIPTQAHTDAKQYSIVDTGSLITYLILQLFNVNKLGETEFWLACIKVCAMTAMIMTCLVSALGGAPNKERTGFQYWADPGAFASYIFPDSAVGRFLGWWACMCQACFAFTGTEVVGMVRQLILTHLYTQSPRRDVTFLLLGRLLGPG